MTTLCGISGTNLCFSVSIVTISPVCDWYRFHICIIYLFVSNVNVIYGTGSIVECKKIKVIFMQLAQTRPFYYFSLRFDSYGLGYLGAETLLKMIREEPVPKKQIVGFEMIPFCV